MSDKNVISALPLTDTYLNSSNSDNKKNYSLTEQEHQEMVRREEIIRTELNHSTEEELLSKLLNTIPSEQGGIVGISGYYFQMLVTIYYIAELIEDKWTFVSMEYHDDIVIGNDETRTVRFIQVKSSKEISKKVSQTDIYKRTDSRNISWIDKLFENSRIFNDTEIIKQFELFCDYFIADTSGRGKVEIKDYYRNEEDDSFDWEIREEDDLYSRLKQDVFDREGQKIIWENTYGYSLKQLLGKLRFTFKAKTPYFINTIQKKLTDLINKNLQDGTIGVTEEDVNWLIGQLLSKCSKGQNKYLLFIKKDEAQKLIYELQMKCVEKSRIAAQSHDNTTLVDKAIQTLLKEIEETGATKVFCENIETALLEYRNILLSTLDRDNSIENLVNRFIKGRKIYIGGTKDIQPFVNDFIRSSFVMYLIFEMFNISSEFERLLIHNSKKGEENFWVSFYHGGIKNFKKSAKGISEIIVETDLEEKLKLILDKTPLYTILHGQNINCDPCKIEISTEQSLENDMLPTENRLTKVTKWISLIPVNEINYVYGDSDEFNSIDEFIHLIETTWEKLKKIGDKA
ncbi:dsDNA nuclease domain-containing protein [Priestia aryabhattai]|uniref:dsDNA nuclease domain-containing protein n=1 Tax=Priestia aryabhattai TaxID=412384 RepID=UPI003B671781